MPEPTTAPTLERRFGLLQATALNMSNMIGIGPFITIPLLMSALGGPQALLGWLVALVIVMADGLVWSELSAAMPGSGGSYRYLREGFGRERWGRMVAFLFIWQFILSGPLEIASGYIGFARYLRYVWPGLTQGGTVAVAVMVGAVNIALLYRRIGSIGRLTVSLWIGTLLTTAAVIVTGAMHFDPALAFDVPPGAFSFSVGFLFGLGAASRVGIYDYLGYYSVAYIGDEVTEPGRVIPRSILITHADEHMPLPMGITSPPSREAWPKSWAWKLVVTQFRVPIFEASSLEHRMVAEIANRLSDSRRRAGQYIGLTETPLKIEHDESPVKREFGTGGSTK